MTLEYYRTRPRRALRVRDLGHAAVPLAPERRVLLAAGLAFLAVAARRSNARGSACDPARRYAATRTCTSAGSACGVATVAARPLRAAIQLQVTAAT